MKILAFQVSSKVTFDDTIDDGNIHALVGEAILRHDDIASQTDEKSEDQEVEDEAQKASLFDDTTTEGVDIASNQNSLEANTLNKEDERRLLMNLLRPVFPPKFMKREGMRKNVIVISQLTAVNQWSIQTLI